MNNNRILFRRGANNKLVANDDNIAYGQPVYDETKKYLVVGKPIPSKFSLQRPITVRDLIGYFADNNGIGSTMADTDKYYIQPTSSALEINSSKDLLLKVSADMKLNLNTTKSLFTGLLNIPNIELFSINGNNDININSNGSYKVNLSRKVELNRDIKFNSNAAVKSKFIVNGEDAVNNSIVVQPQTSTQDFFTNTGRSALNQAVTIGLESALSTLKVFGNANITGEAVIPTIKTKSSGNRIVVSDNSSSPSIIVYNGNSKAFEFTKDSMIANKASKFNQGIIIRKGSAAYGINADTINVSTSIKTVNEQVTGTLTVSNLVIA